MGLTVQETAALGLGASLVLRHLFRVMLPSASRRIDIASGRHSDKLREEFIWVPGSRIASGLLLGGVFSAAIVLAVSRSFWISLAAGATPLLLAGPCIRWYRSRRRKSILSQLPAMLDLVVGHMKAGHSLPESLAETVPLLPPGIREEMSWLLQKTRLGTPLVEAFALFEERVPSEDVSLLVRPLRAALSGGGNVVDLLEQTRDILRRKFRTQEKLRSMTAQARLQAVVLTLLPPVFMAVLSGIDPGFFPGLVGTPQGKAILLAAAILQALGWVTIRRILAVRP